MVNYALVAELDFEDFLIEVMVEHGHLVPRGSGYSLGEEPDEDGILRDFWWALSTLKDIKHL